MRSHAVADRLFVPLIECSALISLVAADCGLSVVPPRPCSYSSLRCSHPRAATRDLQPTAVIYISTIAVLLYTPSIFCVALLFGVHLTVTSTVTLTLTRTLTLTLTLTSILHSLSPSPCCSHSLHPHTVVHPLAM